MKRLNSGNMVKSFIDKLINLSLLVFLAVNEKVRFCGY